jgi:hypothetical protein
MSKIGIMTLYEGNNNYGAVLQAYALSKVLTDGGNETEIIRFTATRNVKFSTFLLEKLKTKGVLQFTKTVFVKALNFLSNKKINKKQNEVFGPFRKKYIHESERVYNSQNISDSLAVYNCFITGSDQVWSEDELLLSPLQSLREPYYLSFVPSDIKKIAYAASLGYSKFEGEKGALAAGFLEDFFAVSAREENGKQILDRVLDGTKEVSVTLDPTLLLRREEWEEIAAPRRFEDKYIFTYFFGENPKDREFVKLFAEKHQLPIVNIPHLCGKFRASDNSFGDFRPDDISPADFLSLIKNAEYIFTDSFHGTVFSIQFEKNFFALKRHSDDHPLSMNERLYTLLGTASITERFIDRKNYSLDYLEKIGDPDYDKIKRLIEEKRTFSFQFLKDSGVL